MNSALESSVSHGEHLNSARLQFSKKLELCRSISLSENQNNMWNLISKINKVRNDLAHSLEVEKRQSAIQSRSSIYDQEFGNIEGMSEEAALCMQAISAKHLAFYTPFPQK